MSKSYSPTVEYRCVSECGWDEPHTLQIVWHDTSDTVEVLVDGESRETYDDSRFFAMVDLANAEIAKWEAEAEARKEPPE